MDELGKYLKAALVPGGSAPIVRLGFHDGISGSAFFSKDFVDMAIDEMSRRMLSQAVNEISPLEGLAIQLLLSSAHISKPEDRAAAMASL